MIGDGNYSARTVRFTSEDDFIVQKMQSLMPTGVKMRKYECNKRYDYNLVLDKINFAPFGVSGIFKKLGVFGQYSHNKVIPEDYMTASSEQRWKLLNGLFDTDGTVGANGECYYTTVSDVLAHQVQQLIWSLGGISKISTRETFYDDKFGNKKRGKLAYKVSARLPEPRKIFSLPRKKEKTPVKYQYANSLKSEVISVEFVGKKQAQCIYIDHPEHLYITDNFVVTHNTETLIGFAANAVTWGSGFLYCDGKGDVALFSKMFALARRFGREDDILVLNFMTGNQDLGASGGKIMSNTLNPFSSGSSDSLTQMVVSLMDDSGGEGGMWKGRATAMLTGVMRALTWLRDEGMVDLNVGEIREFMNLKRIIDLADTAKYPDLPQPIRKTILSYAHISARLSGR